MPEDVTGTAAGLVAVSDLAHGAVHALQLTARDPQGHGVTVGTFLSPQGLAADTTGRLLVANYVPGAVRSFALSPALEPLAPASVLGWRVPAGWAWGPTGASP